MTYKILVLLALFLTPTLSVLQNVSETSRISQARRLRRAGLQVFRSAFAPVCPWWWCARRMRYESSGGAQSALAQNALALGFGALALRVVALAGGQGCLVPAASLVCLACFAIM